MTEFVRRPKVPAKEIRQENRHWFCETCGNPLEIDSESGEQLCPVCDVPEEE